MIARVLVVGLLAGLVLVAGCGAAPDGTGKPAPSPSRTPSASPSPSPTPGPSAADGTRYAACWDGNCEVAVSRQTRIPLRFGSLSVTKLQPHKAMKFDLTLPGGRSGGTLDGKCTAVAHFAFDFSQAYMIGSSCDPAVGPSSPPLPPEPRPAELAIQLVGWTPADAVVIRLATG